MLRVSPNIILPIIVILASSLPSFGQQLDFGQPSVVYDVVVYDEGVSEEQSMRDQAACAQSARRSSGYSPAYGSTSAWDATERVQRTDIGRGVMFGAAIGGAVDTTGTRTRPEAASGAMIGGRRHREAMQQRQQSQYRNRGNYGRALTACLRGRGYTVN